MHSLCSVSSRSCPIATRTCGACIAARLEGIVPPATQVDRGSRMLRIGIVGCGKIADAHLEQIRALGRGEVVAVCDSEPLMAEQLAVRMNVPARYTDFAAMLAGERLDVVHVATPPF